MEEGARREPVGGEDDVIVIYMHIRGRGWEKAGRRG